MEICPDEFLDVVEFAALEESEGDLIDSDGDLSAVRGGFGDDMVVFLGLFVEAKVVLESGAPAAEYSDTEDITVFVLDELSDLIDGIFRQIEDFRVEVCVVLLCHNLINIGKIVLRCKMEIFCS